jgi:hypothetical protein
MSDEIHASKHPRAHGQLCHHLMRGIGDPVVRVFDEFVCVRAMTSWLRAVLLVSSKMAPPMISSTPSIKYMLRSARPAAKPISDERALLFARGTLYAALSVERKVELMQRYSHYQGIVVLLFVGLLLTFSGSVDNGGFSSLGLVLVIASGIALLLDVIKQRRGAGR